MIPIIEVDGLTELAKKNLLSLEITDEQGTKSDQVKMKFKNPNYEIADPEMGHVFSVKIGYEGLLPPVQMGTFQLDELSYSEQQSSTLEITATAQFHVDNNMKAPRDGEYKEKTLGAIFNEIAERNNYTPKIDPDIASIFVDHISQTAESDVAFASRLADDNDASLKFQDLNMLIRPRSKTEGLVYIRKGLQSAVSAGGFVIEIPTGITGKFNARNKYKAVRAFWQDGDKKRRTGEVTGSGEPEFKIQNTFSTKAKAKQAAADKFEQLKRGEASLESVALVGNPNVRSEMELVIQKFHPRICRSWIITKVTHSYTSGSGYTTKISADIKQ